MEIKYPSKEVKEQSINLILKATKGSTKNPVTFLKNTYKEIGSKTIFYGVRTPYLLSLFVYVLAAIFVVKSQFRGVISTNTAAFTNTMQLFFLLSPLSLQVSAWFYTADERSSGVYLLKQTCKYTGKQIAVLRMPAFALLNMAINLIIACIFTNTLGTTGIFYLLIISSVSLFLYGFLSLWLLYYLPKNGTVLLAMLWLIFNIAFYFVSYEIKYTILVGIPLIVYGIMLLILIALFLNSVKVIYEKQASLQS